MPLLGASAEVAGSEQKSDKTKGHRFNSKEEPSRRPNYIRKDVCIYVHVCTYIYPSIIPSFYAYIHICTHTYTYINISLCVCVYIYTCTPLHTFIYTYMYNV